MTGLSVNAWRDPWHVRLVRSAKRIPWRYVGEWVACAVCVVLGMVLIPVALLVMGGPA